jgi:DNA polymerase III sliding clamp (beta) subunit (PCNA family)
MKAVLSTDLLGSALSRCYDACEKKALESIVSLSFENSKLTLSAKGPFSFYEEVISTISVDEDCVFCLKTSTLLEFVKYISADSLILVFDSEKKSCLVSSYDKKSKIALQAIEATVELGQVGDYQVEFDVDNAHEFIAKLNFASKFCSNNFQDYPLTAICCEADIDNFIIQSTNGPSYYSSEIKINNQQACIQIFLPKKSASILKNVFHEQLFNKCSISGRAVLFESDNCKLIFFVLESNNTFPDQVSDWIKKDSQASIKVSVYELSKTLRFFNGVFQEASVNFNIQDEKLSLESKQNNVAAKESVVVEECTGDAKSAYNAKYFLDCLESLQSSWVNLDFIEMNTDFYLCKLTHSNTLILLCPTTF